MRPDKIDDKEKTFSEKLTNNNGIKYSVVNTIDLGNGVSIKSIRPSYETYYYKTNTKKKSICLHFTVGYIQSDIAVLSKENVHTSVSYVVDRRGNIYELFPDECWSYHLGNGCIGGNKEMSSSSIGIEISNYGPLKLSGSIMKDYYGNEYCKKTETDLYMKHDYRGESYFATMTDKQISAVSELLKYICAKHGIPMKFKEDDVVFSSSTEATSYSGIFCHTNVRKDKFDWPMCSSIKRIMDETLAVSCDDSTNADVALEEPVKSDDVELTKEKLCEDSDVSTEEIGSDISIVDDDHTDEQKDCGSSTDTLIDDGKKELNIEENVQKTEKLNIFQRIIRSILRFFKK